MREQFVTELLKQQGYIEKETRAYLYSKTENAGDENFTWFGEEFQNGIFQGGPWCHMFPSTIGKKLGIADTIIPYTASCSAGVKWFKDRHQWGGPIDYLPNRGDFIYFGNADHVGVVIGRDANTVSTIEGNTSAGSTLVANGGSVEIKTYPLTYKKIMGYGVPKYPEEVEDQMAQILEEAARYAGITVEEAKRRFFEFLKEYNAKEEPWEKAGVQYLVDAELVAKMRAANKPLYIGEFGIIAERAGLKKIK